MDTAFLYSQDTLAELMTNIFSDIKLKVSFNDTMSNSLSNGSSKTFWEFHDEPCGKSHSNTVTHNKVIKIFAAFIYIDNQFTLE